jgi:hypothetical protein
MVAQVHLWELARLLEEVRAAAEHAFTWLRALVFWRDARMSGAACVLWQLACSRPRYLPACLLLLLACGLLRASHRAMRAAPEVQRRPSVAESCCLLLLGPERAPAAAVRLTSLLEMLEGRGGGAEGQGAGGVVAGGVAAGGVAAGGVAAGGVVAGGVAAGGVAGGAAASHEASCAEGGGGGGAAAADASGGGDGGGDAGGSRTASPFRVRVPLAPLPLETDYTLTAAAAAPPRLRATASAPLAPSAPVAPLAPLAAPLSSEPADDECHALRAEGDLAPPPG